MGISRARTIESSDSTCTDRASSGLTCEAMLADEAPFHAGTRRDVGKPHRGAGRMVHRNTAHVRKAGAVTQVLHTPARAGVVNTKDGRLVVMRCVQDKSYAEAVSSLSMKHDSHARLPLPAGPALMARPTAVDRPASQARPSKQYSPPGFPECLPPGLALTNQQQALTQAVVGQVQAMLARF